MHFVFPHSQHSQYLYTRNRSSGLVGQGYGDGDGDGDGDGYSIEKLSEWMLKFVNA